MKLTIVGYYGGYPAQNKASSVYIIEKDGFIIVLDMGSGALSKLPNYVDIGDIDAVILSHYHTDHIADVGVLQHAKLIQYYTTDNDTILPIYGHREDIDAFTRLNHDYTKAVPYYPSETMKLGPFFIRFLKTKHSVPCYGMRITDGDSSLIYTADTAFQEEWIPFCQNADLLLADTNFYANMDAASSGHMTSEEVGNIAEAAHVKEVILTHLPHFGDHNNLVTETKSVFSGKVSLAYEGLVWENGQISSSKMENK